MTPWGHIFRDDSTTKQQLNLQSTKRTSLPTEEEIEGRREQRKDICSEEQDYFQNVRSSFLMKS